MESEPKAEWMVCMDFGRPEMTLRCKKKNSKRNSMNFYSLKIWWHEELAESLKLMAFHLRARMIVPILAFFSSLVKGRFDQDAALSVSNAVVASLGTLLWHDDFPNDFSTGLSGMGEALVYGAGWQLFYIAGYKVRMYDGASISCVFKAATEATVLHRYSHRYANAHALEGETWNSCGWVFSARKATSFQSTLRRRWRTLDY